jgi:hypothetical protein
VYELARIRDAFCSFIAKQSGIGASVLRVTTRGESYVVVSLVVVAGSQFGRRLACAVFIYQTYDKFEIMNLAKIAWGFSESSRQTKNHAFPVTSGLSNVEFICVVLFLCTQIGALNPNLH